ncbi:MAG: S8 family serine peptidase [Candidatus Thorarchaeota archaeon]
MLKSKTLILLTILAIMPFISFNNSQINLLNLTKAIYQEDQFFHRQIYIKDALAITNGSKDITVAVIDTGIDFSHPDLQNIAWTNVDEIANNSIDDDGNGYIDDIHGWDFSSGDSNPGPEPGDLVHWHATFIAGIIAAPWDNDGMLGVAPNVTIMNLRLLDINEAFYSYSDFGDAIRYAADNGADVINLSLYAYENSSIYYDELAYAYEKNIPIVSVTGNTYLPAGGQQVISHPGASEIVIAVGATNGNQEKADYSNYGKATEIVAPVGDEGGGVKLWSTMPYYAFNSYYGWGIGTSFACSQVSGVIALMRSLNYSLTVSEIRDILHKSATDLGDPGKDIYFGYGLLNASKAVRGVLDPSILVEKTTKTSNKFVTFASILMVLAIIIPKRRKWNKGS